MNSDQQTHLVSENLYNAIYILCTGKEDVRTRLLDSLSFLITLSNLDFPEYLIGDFEWIISQSTKYVSDYPDTEGQLEATMKRIKKSTGTKIASRIFYLYSEIQKLKGYPLI